ncbi:hypothetical protein [Vibrio cyclitrophicus]|uniref:hypothetical protein n=1 Tax=Vibrio cyclitrophicus TaxID=47951 RepID=UPI000C82C31E|nr:hypothetical protein [Vibrio cyclitrophicus]PMH74235.1 hypothetical protein BCU59_21385 [Vibrio cyclitrophicus]
MCKTDRKEKSPTKKELSAMAFLKAPEGLTQLSVNVVSQEQANQRDRVGAFWSSCLHTDVSTLKNDHGIEFKKGFEVFESLRGHTTRFKRYRLAGRKEARKAAVLINRFRRKRGAMPLGQKEIAALIARH